MVEIIQFNLKTLEKNQRDLLDSLLLQEKREDFLNSRMSEKLFRYLLRLLLENPEQFEDLIPLFNSFSQGLIAAYDTAKNTDKDPAKAEVTTLIEEHVNVDFGIGFSFLENGDLMINFAQNPDDTAEVLYLYAEELTSMSVVEIVNKILATATRAFPEYLDPTQIRHQLEKIIKFSHENLEFLEDIVPLPEGITFPTLLNLYFSQVIIVSNDLFELINAINSKKAAAAYAEQAHERNLDITKIMEEARNILLNKNEDDLLETEKNKLKKTRLKLEELIRQNVDFQELMDLDFQKLSQNFSSIQTMLLLSMDLHEDAADDSVAKATSLLALSIFQAAQKIESLLEIASLKTNSLLSTALFQFRKVMENPELPKDVKLAQTLLVLRRLNEYKELTSWYKKTSKTNSSNA